MLAHGQASAQARTALVEPTSSEGPLARSLERVIRTRLSELAVGGEIESSPLVWRDLELAAGCVGEDAACYSVVAAQLGVDELVLASIDVSGEDCVVELVRWRAAGVSRRVLEAHGPRVRFAILDRVAPALRELYELPEAPRVETTEPVQIQAPTVAPPARGVDPIGPITLGVVGLASVAAGLALMVAFDGSRAAWVSGPTSTMRDVDLLLDAHQRAERELLGAEIVFGVAAAAIVAAAVWLVVELTGAHDQRSELAMMGAGLRL